MSCLFYIPVRIVSHRIVILFHKYNSNYDGRPSMISLFFYVLNVNTPNSDDTGILHQES